MKLPPALRAFRYYNFRLYFSGQAISLIGTWMQRIAVSWLVYNLTHSAFMLGLVAFAGQIPILLFSAYAGAYVDRHSRYKTLLFTQVASMIQAGLLAIVVWNGSYNVTIIILLSVLLGIINAFDTPSRQSFMILLVEDKKHLPNAIALNSTMVTLARLLGPAVAGILLSSYGEDICFLINFLSFIAVIVSLLFMKLNMPARPKNTEPIWIGLRAGYTYIKGDVGLRSVVFLTAAMSLLVMPYTTLLPVYAASVFKGDVTTFSWLNSISGLGALLGAIYMATRKAGSKYLRIIAYSVLIFSVGLIVFSYTKNFTLALVFLMIAEAGLLTEISASNTYIQTHVDEHMRGRVISYYVMAFMGMQPIGGLLIGSLAHFTSTPFTVLVEGVCGVAAGLLFIPVLKKVRKSRINKKAAVA
ncbi:MFS transporter [Ginsengibacter hankyongi]|uniref:MFS transporter n=1 Tax=Ginsengibacter hankyongi TaxID=2607284 RepID=A0A5J5IF50_9BACT|nr:MFS transporter [Ginsengibacter hankyongi]KAA9038482.1 MFS transporter [Ginsengibacter hankyongi]